MSVDCRIKLIPMPSSRSAAAQCDWEGTKTFPQVPAEGESITLADDWGGRMTGRTYMVQDVEWRLPLNGNVQGPSITAVRSS
jgi:hypothetical protein